MRGVYDALDQVVYKDAKWLFGCLVCAAWWTLALVFCRTAYAAPSVEINGNFAGYENNETYNGYVVVDAPNEYIATLTLIGEYSSLPQIDSDMYAKLSNESSGGRFYELVQQWQVMGTNASGTAGNYPTWAGSTYFIDGLNTVYGYGNVWECAITDALKNGAKQDFLTVLDGGSIGGGASGTADNTTIPSTIVMIYTGNGNKYLGDTVTVNIDNTVSEYWTSRFNTNNMTYCFASLSENSWANLWMCNFEYELIYTGNRVTHIKNISSIGGQFCNIICQYDNGTITASQYGNNYNPHPVAANGFYDISNINYFWPLEGSDTGGGSGGGDNNWPDDDTPQPPSPNPPTPTTPDPDPGPTLPPIDPHDPVIPNPPTNEPAPTGTTPTDYTPWLRAILQQLVNLTSYLETCFTWLGTALDDHCQHIRDHMTTCFNWLGEYEITGMSNLLGEHHTFLNGLAQWIVDNIKWENSGGEFDDSNMIYWLRRIYARQGSGDVNSRPVDPATDYSGFAGWLGVLYDAVALDVSDTSLTALTSSLSGLQHTFPFSLPWDVKQVLQALDVSPVTPSASIPSGTSGVSYDVDLHWMDSAMVSVRAFELLVFIVYVMVHTKDLFGYLMGE